MYCIMRDVKCSCFAFREEEHTILARNSDFLTSIEKQTARSQGKDTVWSVIYDTGSPAIYRCEGNPSRKKFSEDKRFLPGPAGKFPGPKGKV